MSLTNPGEEFGPGVLDDDGREHRLSEDEARSALGAAGGVLVAMIAWDFGAHDWVTFDPRAMPVYLPPLLRFGVRWAGVAVGPTIFTIAWREQRPSVERVELNGRAFVPGRRPGARE